MKKKFLCTFCALMVALTIFTGCGSSKSSDASFKHDSKSPNSNMTLADEAYTASEDYGYDYSEEVSMDFTADEMGSNSMGDLNGNGLKKVAPEMLVYRCNLGIDTTEFDETLANLRAKIKEYGGFVETERLEDNCYKNSDYIVAKDERLRSFSATIRIPSDKYAEFVGCAEGLGIVNSKYAYVDDVTQTYGTLATTLAIYESDYDMYLEQLENTKDADTRILLQQEIRDLAIEIASIKTSMSSIENDVAYSYITISIDEYLVIPEPEPEPEPEPDPTFGQRLKEEIKDSWDSFLEFCEDFLFFIIESWWGFAFFLLVVFVIFIVIKLFIKFIKKKSEKAKIKRELDAEEYKLKVEAERQRRLEAKEKEEKQKTQNAKQQASDKAATNKESNDSDKK